MKTSPAFKEVISNYLKSAADKDPLFAETLKKPNKTIDECINYILATVQKSGKNGFADEEIFNMAIHYYDEDDIKNIKPIDARVVVNHKVKDAEPYKMTSKDKEIAKAHAYNEFIEEEKEVLRNKNKSKKVKKEETLTPTLFD